MHPDTHYHPNLADTEQLVRESIGHLTDKAGRSLADHCARVVAMVPESEHDAVRHVAWLHDIIEDSLITADDLRGLGYAEGIVQAVEHCTHADPKAVPYMDYIRLLIASGDRMAVLVKYLDNRDNAAVWRLVGLEPEVRDWLIARYAGAAPLLRAALGEGP